MVLDITISTPLKQQTMITSNYPFKFPVSANMQMIGERNKHSASPSLEVFGYFAKQNVNFIICTKQRGVCIIS